MSKSLKKDPAQAFPQNSPVVPSVYDTRLRTRMMGKGVLTEKALNKHVESLPDESANADFMDYATVTGSGETLN